MESSDAGVCVVSLAAGRLCGCAPVPVPTRPTTALDTPSRGTFVGRQREMGELGEALKDNLAGHDGW